MREIKFRAWDRESNLMEEDIVNPIGYQEYPKRWVVMQYTGLKDKNKKRIFEGDILKVPGDFMKDCFWIVQWDSRGWYDDLPKNPHEAEIIGNIYENPDLLKI